MIEILSYTASLYLLGYCAKLLTMGFNDSWRTENAKQDGIEPNPLYSMEDYLILPALWPKDVIDFLRGLR